MPTEDNTLILCDEAQEFLELKSESTSQNYRNGLRRFVSYFREQYGDDKTLSDFLDILEEDAGLPRREKKRIAEKILSDFITFLEHKNKSNNTIRTYIAAVKNFMKYKGFEFSTTFLANLPRSIPKKVNRKHQWKLEEIREFVERATNFRDKAIIMVLLQSGMSISDLCQLNYGDVRKQLEEETLPIMLYLARLKTGVRYRTCIGADAVHYLKAYLRTRKDLDDYKPLFTKWNSDTERITEGAIQKKFKECAKELDFIDNESSGMNPARPHSLRSAFRSRLTGKIDGDLIEYFIGHEIGSVKNTYINLPDDELREIYSQFEHLLSIETTSKDVLAERDGKTIHLNEEYKEKISALEMDMKRMSRIVALQVSENKIITESFKTLAQQVITMRDIVENIVDDPSMLTLKSEELEHKQRELLALFGLWMDTVSQCARLGDSENPTVN